MVRLLQHKKEGMIHMDEQRSAAYDAVIPANVRYDDRLSANAKLLYGEIRALSNLKGYCYATNAYLSDQSRLGLTERSVQRLIKQLDELGYIYVRLLGKPVGNVAFGRRIYVNKSAVDLFDAETPTKLSGGDKIVGGTMTKLSGSTINNNNKIKEDARAKKKQKKCNPDVVKASMKEWVLSLNPTSGQADELISCLNDFVDFRASIAKPIAEVSGVKYCERELMRCSDGNIDVMIATVKKAIFRSWSGFYRLKPDELEEAIGGAAICGSPGEDGGDKWL